MAESLFHQVIKGLIYYFSLLSLMRLLGKRLAGQTTTFDLLVLITLGVVLQTSALAPGPINALVFILTVLAAHKSLALACSRFPTLRAFVRGRARPLIRNGIILYHALDEEGLSEEELMAGLRKLGHLSAKDVKLAVLEETGHISAVTHF